MAALAVAGQASPANSASPILMGSARNDATGFPTLGSHVQPPKVVIPGVTAPGLMGGGTGVGGSVIPTVGQVWPRTS